MQCNKLPFLQEAFLFHGVRGSEGKYLMPRNQSRSDYDDGRQAGSGDRPRPNRVRDLLHGRTVQPLEPVAMATKVVNLTLSQRSTGMYRCIVAEYWIALRRAKECLISVFNLAVKTIHKCQYWLV